VKRYLDENKVGSLLTDVYGIIVNGDANGFQKRLTAFLHEYLSLFFTPHHREEVYQALCYMLIFSLFGNAYDVRMEHDAGFGRSDITAHPLGPHSILSVIFEIKAVATHIKRKGKRTLKSADGVKRDLEKAKAEALKQMEVRRYRDRAPPHVKRVHEYAFVFAGKYCLAAVRTLERDATGDWCEVTTSTSVTSDNTVDGDDMDMDMDEDEDTDEDTNANV